MLIEFFLFLAYFSSLYGKQYSIKINFLTLLLINLLKKAQSTTNGDCEFYTGMENLLQCGANGYPLGYGYKYCKIFSSNLGVLNQDVWIIFKLNYMKLNYFIIKDSTVD